MTFELPVQNNAGLSDIEIELLQKPAGVLETYHVSVNTFDKTLDELEQSQVKLHDRELFRTIIHKIIASTAEYGYTAGFNDGIIKEKDDE